MSVMPTAVRLLLAALFLLAGAGKLADRQAAEAAAADLGLPRRFAGVAASALPCAEIALAGGLALRPSARVAAFAAIVLLLIFTIVVGVALARGRRPACHCFGPLTRTAAGPVTLARDVIMLMMAASVALRGPGVASVGGTAAALTALAAGACAAAPFVAALRHENADLRDRQERLAARLRALETAAAPAFGAVAPTGGPVAGEPAPPLLLATAEHAARRITPRAEVGRDLLLLFLEPGCEPCARLLPDIARWQRELSGRLACWVVYGEDPQAAAHVAHEYGLSDMYAQPDRIAAQEYRIPGTPTGVLIGSDGIVAVPFAAGYQVIHELVDGLASARADALPAYDVALARS